MCRLASHLVSWTNLLFNQVSPPPNSREGLQRVLNNGTHQARDAPVSVARRSRERQEDGTYSGTHPFLIWSRKLVKSTREKVGIRPPEGVKNPVWPAPEADERAAARALKHEWQTYRTQAGEQRTAGRVKQLRRRSERVLGKASYLDPSSVILRDPRGKSEEGLSIVNKTRCHQKWRDGKARPRHSCPVLTPHRETLGGRCRTSTSLPRLQGEPRIYNSNEGQVLYGIPLSNEQVFVGQWPKGQIKLRGSLLRPRQKTPHRETLGGRCRTYPSDRSSKGNLGITEFEGQVRGGDEGKSYLVGIMATDNVTVTDT